jgi:hypothetical protein
LPREGLRGKNCGVVLLDERPQKSPDFGIRIGKIDVAAPDPVLVRLGAVADERGRLRIVNDDEVFL